MLNQIIKRMTIEDKELLLKDLCARLPYGVICYNRSTESNFILNEVTDTDSDRPTFDYGYGELEVVEPYLRPMSSMTKEEIHEFQEILGPDTEVGYDFVDILDSSVHTFSFNELQALFDWLNKNHFDYRGLIPKNLAIEVTKENNPYII